MLLLLFSLCNLSSLVHRNSDHFQNPTSLLSSLPFIFIFFLHMASTSTSSTSGPAGRGLLAYESKALHSNSSPKSFAATSQAISPTPSVTILSPSPVFFVKSKSSQASETSGTERKDHGKAKIPSVYLGEAHWFDTTVSTLSQGSMENLRALGSLPSSYSNIIFGLLDCPSSPPKGIHTFLRDQLHSGLQFSIPSLFIEVTKFHKVPLNQLHPNSFSIMATT